MPSGAQVVLRQARPVIAACRLQSRANRDAAICSSASGGGDAVVALVA